MLFLANFQQCLSKYSAQKIARGLECYSKPVTYYGEGAGNYRKPVTYYGEGVGNSVNDRIHF